MTFVSLIKKYFCLVSISFICLGFVDTTVNANTMVKDCEKWNDVAQEKLDRVKAVCMSGWMKGYENKDFGLDNNLSRIEMVSLVNNVLGLKVSGENAIDDFEVLNTIFNDSIFQEYDSGYDWMYANLQVGRSITMKNNEVIWKGYPDGSFKPLQGVNTVEFLKVVMMALDFQESLNGNYRLNTYAGSEWYSNFLNFLVERKVIVNVNQEFRVAGKNITLDQLLTREEAVLILSEMLWTNTVKQNFEYEVAGLKMSIPAYLAFESDTKLSFSSWRAKRSGMDLILFKVLETDKVQLPDKFVNIFTPNRLVAKVSNLYRSDQCSTTNTQCIRVYWFELKDGRTVILEGSFQSEKSTTGQAVVDEIMRSVSF